MAGSSSGASLFAPHPTIPFLFPAVTDSTASAGTDPIAFCIFRGNSGAAPSTDANTYHHGCIALVVDGTGGNVVYQNTGSYASPTWTLFDTGTGFSLPTTATDSTTTTGTSFGITDSTLTTGVGESITASATTTGTIFEAIAAAATLTTGFYYAANDGALNVFTVGANGHITSKQTTAPTIATNSTGITAVAVTAGSTDTCGTVTTTGTPQSGTVLTLTFNKTYTVAPKVVVYTPANAAAGGVNTMPIVTQSATTAVFTWPAAGTYAATPSFTYLVIA